MIRYGVESPSQVTVRVRNTLGETVETVDAGMRETGSHELLLDVTSLDSGVYVVEVNAGEGREIMKLVVAK